jgi:hypothetical protein
MVVLTRSYVRQLVVHLSYDFVVLWTQRRPLYRFTISSLIPELELQMIVEVKLFDRHSSLCGCLRRRSFFLLQRFVKVLPLLQPCLLFLDPQLQVLQKADLGYSVFELAPLLNRPPHLVE